MISTKTGNLETSQEAWCLDQLAGCGITYGKKLRKMKNLAKYLGLIPAYILSSPILSHATSKGLHRMQWCENMWRAYSPAGGGGVSAPPRIRRGGHFYILWDLLKIFIDIPKNKSAGHVPFRHTFVLTSKKNQRSPGICHIGHNPGDQRFFLDVRTKMCPNGK